MRSKIFLKVRQTICKRLLDALGDAVSCINVRPIVEIELGCDSFLPLISRSLSTRLRVRSIVISIICVTFVSFKNSLDVRETQLINRRANDAATEAVLAVKSTAARCFDIVLRRVNTRLLFCSVKPYLALLCIVRRITLVGLINNFSIELNALSLGALGSEFAILESDPSFAILTVDSIVVKGWLASLHEPTERSAWIL